MQSPRLICLTLWVLAAATTAFADAPSVETEASQLPVASFYPAAALAAGISGEATLLCERSANGALAACRISEEQPVGQGFGAAALALAAKSADGCGGSLSPGARTSRPIRFSFRAPPGTVEPDPRQPGWTLTTPAWRKVPEGHSFLRFYPEQAARNHVTGETAIQCIAATDGRMVQCQAIAETPAGFDFGKAALAISTLFAVSQATCGGHFAGASIVIPIRFQIP
jgi:hypothetical protein